MEQSISNVSSMECILQLKLLQLFKCIFRAGIVRVSKWSFISENYSRDLFAIRIWRSHSAKIKMKTICVDVHRKNFMIWKMKNGWKNQQIICRKMMISPFRKSHPISLLCSRSFLGSPDIGPIGQWGEGSQHIPITGFKIMGFPWLIMVNNG